MTCLMSSKLYKKESSFVIREEDPTQRCPVDSQKCSSDAKPSEDIPTKYIAFR